MNILIPMAGNGKRFKDVGYELPKPMIKFLGQSMIEWAIDTLGLHGTYIFVILKEHAENGLYDLLLAKKPDCKIVIIDKMTNGSAETALLAKQYIDNEDELISTNCDQIMRWNVNDFINFKNDNNVDGILVTYYANTSKNSYARVNSEGYVDLVKEKEVISNLSLNGIHYWKQGKFFVESAFKMIEKNDRVNNEFYIAPTYNYMIRRGLKVKVFNIPNEYHIPIGTPEDLEKYLREVKI